ncbi:DUF2591 domain-containing protein [Salmonella enterica subsp. enterica serovar Mbandaka]|nr:DUF2591 domain-containing protein [Salmonella enterica subsp. enterica serovar Mbandaka]
MTMDYSQLSDQEINDMVILQQLKNGFYTDDPQEVSNRDFVRDGWCWGRGTKTGLHNKDGSIFVTHQNGYRLDYCHNASIAWGVIPKHLISLSPDYDFENEDEITLIHSGLWVAEKVYSDGKAFIHKHANPLRAAMIVFLMMQDANNA